MERGGHFSFECASCVLGEGRVEQSGPRRHDEPGLLRIPALRGAVPAVPSCVNQDPGIFLHEGRAGDKPWVHWRCPRPHHGPRGGHRNEKTARRPRLFTVEPACSSSTVVRNGVGVGLNCLCCLCNKLARHWSTPKTSPEGHDRRDVPGSCRARSPALHVGGRDRVASWSWSRTSHPHAHLHAQLGLISASAAPSAVIHHRYALALKLLEP